MPAPPHGHRRVFTRTNVGNHRHSQWVDVREGEQLDAWLDAQLVTLVDYGSQPAPADLPPGPCCGQR